MRYRSAFRAHGVALGRQLCIDRDTEIIEEMMKPVWNLTQGTLLILLVIVCKLFFYLCKLLL